MKDKITLRDELGNYKNLIFIENLHTGELNIHLGSPPELSHDDTVVRSGIFFNIALNNSEDFIKLGLIKDILDRNYIDEYKQVNITYLGYVINQDRVCNKSEAHSLRVMYNYINFLNFDKVVVTDAHRITQALLNNCEVQPRKDK